MRNKYIIHSQEIDKMQITDLGIEQQNVLYENPLVASIAAVEQREDIPSYYVKINLSTEGKVGAPKEFHIKNFSTRDIMELALTEEKDIPEKLLHILQSLIYEKNVDVSSFHESEVVETMVRLYVTFFSPILEIDFPVEESDYEELRALDSKDAENKIQALKAGKWKPKVAINILNDINTYPIPEDFKPYATIISKKSKFSITFGLPKYGDIIVIKKWLAENYDNQEKKFAKLKKMLELYNSLMDRYNAGEDIDLNKLPVIDPVEEDEFNKFQLAKAAALVDVIRALHLVNFDGKDVRDMPLSERTKLVQDPRVDVSVAKKIDMYFDNLKFGIDPEVQMLNPITGKPCKRRYSFRLADLLQAMQLSESDEYDIVFTDLHGNN